MRISRVKDVVIMMVLFNIWPEQIYRFSTRKLLPAKKNRFSKKIKPIIPFELLEDKSSNINKIKEIDLIGLGESFNFKNLKEIKKPTFFVSFWGPLKRDGSGNLFYKNPDMNEMKYNLPKVMDELFNEQADTEFKKNDNVTYVCAREDALNHFKKNGYRTLSVSIYSKDTDGKNCPLSSYWETPSYKNLFDDERFKNISLLERVYQPPFLDPYPNWSPTGSFLPTICALSYYAEKINVYGWDFYLDKPAEHMSYWKLFFKMYKYKADVYRSNNHFESALINFYYAYQLSKLPNINIHSYMGKLDRHHKLIEKIERVLFN